MELGAYPTRENPFRFGPHTYYCLGPRVDVAVFDGDVDSEHLLALLEVTRAFGGNCVARIRDVRKLGKVPRGWRSLLTRDKVKSFGELRVEPHVFLVKDSVVIRAMVRLAMTAVRLMSSQRIRVIPTETLAEARDKATAYASAIDEEIGPVSKRREGNE